VLGYRAAFQASRRDAEEASLRHVALFAVALAWGCNKDGNTPIDTDTEVIDTEPADTDVTGPPPEKNLEVDPDVTATYQATFSMVDNAGEEHSETYELTDSVTFNVVKTAGKWYRHYAGTKQVTNVWTDAPDTITVAMDVVVPNDDVSTGDHTCKGAVDYAVLVALKAGQNAIAFSSLGLEKNPTAGPCRINVDTVNDKKFIADIETATVTTGKDQSIVATVTDAHLKIPLREKAD
jgi:hypothetical protein